MLISPSLLRTHPFELMPTAQVGLPRKITSESVARLAHPEETVCMVIETKGSSFNAMRFQGKGNKIFMFDYDPARRAHCFRCPQTVWEANHGELAKTMYQSPTLRNGRTFIVPRCEPWVAPPKRAAVLQRRFGTEALHPSPTSSLIPDALPGHDKEPSQDGEPIETLLERELGELTAVE